MTAGMNLISLSLLACSVAVIAAPSFPLDSMLARGDSCLAVEWTPDSLQTGPDWYVRNGSRCTGSDTVYLHSDFSAGATYRSIAYSYGGEDPYAIFRIKVLNGYLIGSHLCHYLSFGDPSPVIAGTDCSGFVCYIWNVPRASTAGLAADPRYEKIPFAAIEAGDILVKASSHSVFVVEKDDSSRFIIWESTSAVNGCRERMIDINDTQWAPYVALRNSALVRLTDRTTRHPARAGPRCRKNATGTIAITLEQRFSGRIDLSDVRGRHLASMPLVAGPGTVSWRPATRPAGGVYILSLRRGDGPADRAILFPGP
jgi:hypothetical protein